MYISEVGGVRACDPQPGNRFVRACVRVAVTSAIAPRRVLILLLGVPGPTFWRVVLFFAFLTLRLLPLLLPLLLSLLLPKLLPKLLPLLSLLCLQLCFAFVFAIVFCLWCSSLLLA